MYEKILLYTFSILESVYENVWIININEKKNIVIIFKINYKW